MTSIGALLRRRSIRGAIGIAASAGAGQAIAFAAYPLLTRIYSPGDFGVLAVFSSVVAIVSIFAAGKYEMAIPLSTDKRSADILLVLSIGMGSATAALVMVGLYYHNKLTAIELFPATWPYLILVLIGIIGHITYKSLVFRVLRLKAYTSVARSTLVQAVGSVTAKTAIGLSTGGGFGLILGHVIGQGGGSWRLFKQVATDFSTDLSRDEFLQEVKRYWKHPALLAPAGLLNALGLHIAPIAIAAVYGVANAGVFAVATKLLGVPMQLVGQSLAKVFLGEAPHLMRRQYSEFRKAYRITAISLIATAIPVTIGMAMLMRVIVPIVFGSEWAEAGSIGIALIPMISSQLVVSPLSQTLIMLERQAWQLVWDLVRCLSVILMFVYAKYNDLVFIQAVWTYSIVICILYIVMYIITHISVVRGPDAGNQI